MDHVKTFSEMRVLDFSRYLLGGFCTQALADFGAEVIKVEDMVRGDFCRYDFPVRNGTSYYMTALGRSKKSIAVDLKDEEVSALILELASGADIVVESFRPGVMERLGLGYAAVAAVNPSIIYCSISGYGHNDPRSLKAQHDLNMQAATGYLSVNGVCLTPLPLVDYATHSVALQAVLAAVHERDAEGKGAYIDVSMFDSFVWWNSLLDSRWCFNGGQCHREDLDYPAVAYNIYETEDGGYLAFAMVEEKFWRGFCDKIGAPDLVPFRLDRIWEAPEAFARMAELVRGKTLAEWEEWLEGEDLCIEPVIGKSESLARILADDSGSLRWVDFPQAGRVLQSAAPHRVSSLPFDWGRVSECSALGADTVGVLGDLGVSETDAARLAAKGSVLLRGRFPCDGDHAPVFPGRPGFGGPGAREDS